MSQRTKLELNEKGAELLNCLLKSHRSQILKHMGEISPIKNWLAYKMCGDDLYATEALLDQIREPYIVDALA
jgi:hypothetical protein